MNISISRLRNWATLSSISIVDQALISGSNFLLSILLARWLSPDGYGLYGIVYSIFLLMVWMHSAIILEPLTVFGTGRYLDRLGRYFRANLLLNLSLTLALSVLVSISALFAYLLGAVIAGPLLALAFSVPFIFLFWLFRRECYVLGKPLLAVWGSLIYALVNLVGVGLLQSIGEISATTALTLLGVASIASSLIVGIQIWRNSESKKPSIDVEWREVLKAHWLYGRWVVATGVVYWLVNLVYVPLVGIVLGSDKAGLIKAYQNLFLPVEHILTALGLLLLPRLSMIMAADGKEKVLKLSGQLSLGALIGAGVYSIVVTLSGDFIVENLYQKDFYNRNTDLIVFFSLIAVLVGIRFGLVNGLRAIEKPQAYFYANAAGALTSVSVGFLMVVQWDILGAVGGQLLSTLVSVLVLIYIWWKIRSADRDTAEVDLEI